MGEVGVEGSFQYRDSWEGMPEAHYIPGRSERPCAPQEA